MILFIFWRITYDRYHFDSIDFTFNNIEFLYSKGLEEKNFVKELYIDEKVSVVLYVITIAITIGLLTVYFILSKGEPYSWLPLVILLVEDWILLFVMCITATTCVYLEDKTLIKKNIFFSKKILLNKETKIIEKTFKRIIKSGGKSISISSRYLSGGIRTFIHKIKIIINE